MQKTMLEFGKQIENAATVERICVYAIAQNENGAIALTRTPKGYFLPGGGVDAGESLEAALEREIREEISYQSAIGDKVGVAVQYLYAQDEDTHYKKIGHFYHAVLNDKIFPPAETHHELIWCARRQAPEMLRHEFQAWAVRRANDF